MELHTNILCNLASLCTVCRELIETQEQEFTKLQAQYAEEVAPDL